MTVGEMLSRISSAELTEWAAYEQEAGPLDVGRRIDVVGGIIASTIANVNRDPKKGKRFQPDDFVSDWAGSNRPQSMQEQIAMVTQINRTLGGKDLRRSK